jgi:hypothetical protein
MQRLRDNRGDAWERVISHCQHEMNYAARALYKQRDDDVARAVEGVAQLDKIPEDDVARRLAAAQRILKPTAAVRGKRKDDLQKELQGEQGGGASVDVFREGNSTTGRRVRGTDADAGQVLADCGKGMVDAFDGGSVPDAYAAMCEKFVGGWPELTGANGDEWCLLSELSYPVFRDVVRTMPPKAVGCSGVAVQLLKAASEQVLRRFYEAIVSDLQRDTISLRAMAHHSVRDAREEVWQPGSPHQSTRDCSHRARRQNSPPHGAAALLLPPHRPCRATAGGVGPRAGLL